MTKELRACFDELKELNAQRQAIYDKINAFND